MFRWAFVCVAALAGAPALAQVAVSGAWVRATVPGQMGTGAFMTLVSKEGARVVGAASPVAGVVEIHETAMDGNVMKMRAVSVLELPPGKPVELKPGGYHVMLLDLSRTLKAGERIPLSLRIETRAGTFATLPVEIEVAMRAPAPGAGHKK
jgi:copper(I)-binding protein